MHHVPGRCAPFGRCPWTDVVVHAPRPRCRTSGKGVRFQRSGCRTANGQGVVFGRHIQAVDGGLDMDAVCEREKLSIEEFYAKYGTPVVTTNLYDADGFIGLLSEINSFIQNGNLKSELQYLMDQTEQAKETHRMEIVNDIYKKLHDLDYFLLRYGPKDVAKYVEDDSTVSKYYGTLPFY